MEGGGGMRTKKYTLYMEFAVRRSGSMAGEKKAGDTNGSEAWEERGEIKKVSRGGWSCSAKKVTGALSMDIIFFTMRMTA